MGRHPGSCLRHLTRDPAPLWERSWGGPGCTLATGFGRHSRAVHPLCARFKTGHCRGCEEASACRGLCLVGAADTKWTSRSTGLWSLGQDAMRDRRAGLPEG